MSKKFVVIAYDIPNDKRRTKLHNLLKDYGTPVQYSLFECLISAKQLAQLQERIQKVIKPRLDHVRYYHLCKSCHINIETTQASKEITREKQVLVL